MRRQRSAKIVATLGPASSTPEMIEALFNAGVDVFRLNFSHGKPEEHRARYDAIRTLEKRLGRPIGIMADLQGPKLRVGTFAEGKVKLVAGRRFRLDLAKTPGDAKRAPLPHPEVFEALEPGTDLLLDDGNIRLKVEKCGKDFAETVIVTGGDLSDRKGVNVPNVVLAVSPLTAKDRADLAFALGLGVDWIALSFVQRPEDVAEGRKLVAGRAGVLVKLEKPAAIQRLDGIIELADAVMVARGDLGVEMPPEEVPPVQRHIVRASRIAGKPVVVATQMLESMVRVPVPTRAEASDVATAVYEGADAVMLSAETAAGSYPLEAVTIMDRIIRRVQADPDYFAGLQSGAAAPEHTASDAISAAARQVAHTIGAAAILSYTTSGATALRAARERPEVPILALTSNPGTARRLALVWGLHCVQARDVTNFTEMVQRATSTAHREGFAKRGDRIVITAGVPFGTPGATNILRIAWIEE
ncbi:MAG TPA: pyruvate kinase [Stellaceae bacterium]|nr:pyruvate kinase [Stellaceae bacterium]